MSGLEGFGAAVAVAQLLSYAISISFRSSDLRARIRGGQDSLRQYERQVKELEVVAAHVEQNKALQTDDVKTCLAAIVAQTEAAKKILTKFKRSSRVRQQLAIMNGDLTRRLDITFGDVQKTTDRLGLLMGSLTAQGQQELTLKLTELALTSEEGVATAAQVTTIIGEVSPGATNMPESVDRKAGSHSYKGIKFKNNRKITMGNTSNGTPNIDPDNTRKLMAGHTYKDLTAMNTGFLHMGNTGGNSEGHNYEDVEVEGQGQNQDAKLGDYLNMATKHEDIALHQADAGRNAEGSS